MTTIDITARGATANAPADETTDAIQNAINGMSSGDTLLVPSGSFNINAGGIKPKSNSIIQLNGQLQQFTNPNEDSCRIIMLTDKVDTVTVQGAGVLRGDRDTHVGDTKESGAMGACVEIREGASNIILTGFNAINSWADGIVFCPVPQSSTCPKGAIIDGVNISDNRRNGLSVINGDTIHVMNCQIRRNGKGARPTPPYLGIDLECDINQYVCQNIIIEKNIFDNNGQVSHDGNFSAGSPAGTYRNIYVAPSNVYDWRYRPIIVSGHAGKEPAPAWAVALEGIFRNWSGYRHWGYPNTWRSQ